MSWTTPGDVRAQVQKLWDRGVLLAALVFDEVIFPRRLALNGPNSTELAERFAEVRAWIARLDSGARHYRVKWRTVNHRIIGTNVVPAELWIDSMDAALGLLGRQRESARFVALVALTREREPKLLLWLARRPLRALELAEVWPTLLDIIAWLVRQPRPGIYLRQIDLPGVHSKFIESHRGVLAELFDLTLSSEVFDAAATSNGSFCRRYGFLDKPARVRFRLLDPALALLPTATDQDLTVTAETFSQLNLPVTRVFMTENEINFLAFPSIPRSMILFGAGYGFEALAEADWLRNCEFHYWGDLDTHGFAILDQLRGLFPQAASLLMDRQTLLAHRHLWGKESHPETRNLSRLTGEEYQLYDDLRFNRLGEQVRLEQERVAFGWVREALARMC